jgi:hypothetical protein
MPVFLNQDSSGHIFRRSFQKHVQTIGAALHFIDHFIARVVVAPTRTPLDCVDDFSAGATSFFARVDISPIVKIIY